MSKLITIILFSLLAGAVVGQGYYFQSIMPDGRKVIGDKPAPGAKEVHKMPLTRGNTSTPLSNPGQPAEGAATRQQTLEAADAEVSEAERNLAAAKAALEAGREPQASERIGIAKGGSRLTEAYAKRIQSLESGVTSAQKQLDDALARRNAAR
jgi:hypothetical protein